MYYGFCTNTGLGETADICIGELASGVLLDLLPQEHREELKGSSAQIRVQLLDAEEVFVVCGVV